MTDDTPDLSVRLYADRNPWELEPHYCAHVDAMTREGLHSKADIAAELAYRDKRLDAQRAEIEQLRAERQHGVDSHEPFSVLAWLRAEQKRYEAVHKAEGGQLQRRAERFKLAAAALEHEHSEHVRLHRALQLIADGIPGACLFATQILQGERFGTSPGGDSTRSNE